MKSQLEIDKERFEFWKKMFEPRTAKWQRETLRRLKSAKSIFETDEDRIHKIVVLESLLGI